MIKLKTLISEIYISGFTSTDERSKFQMPENFDKYGQGAGWYAYRGCNDWENGTTSAAVYFEGIHDKSRIWMNIQYPPHFQVGENVNPNTPTYQAMRAWGDKASRTWLREARKIHRIPREYFPDGQPWLRDWKECFQMALTSPSMKQYVKEWGVDGTTWKAYRPSSP